LSPLTRAFFLDSLTLAAGTLANFLDRATRLYELERRRPKGSSPLGAYVKRWWASSGSASVQRAPWPLRAILSCAAVALVRPARKQKESENARQQG
jgi:hypothetical protein